MSILIVKLGALGDCIEAEGAVRDIRTHHRGKRLVMLTGRAHAGLWRRCPHIDAVIADPRLPRWRLDALWRLRGGLQGEAIDAVYDLQNSGRTALYRRLMLRRADWSGRAAGARWPAPYGNREGIAIHDRLAAQLSGAGIAPQHCHRPDLGWLAAEETAADAVLARHDLRPPYIVLLPGSSASGAHKRWPHFAALARLLAEAGQQTITVPGPGEQALCRAIPARMIIGTDAANSPLDLADLATVLSRAAFVIGNDSGPSHLAACLGVPGLALFGPHMPARLSGIEKPGFDTIEVADLASLSPQGVFQQVMDRLSQSPVPPDRPVAPQYPG